MHLNNLNTEKSLLLKSQYSSFDNKSISDDIIPVKPLLVKGKIMRDDQIFWCFSLNRIVSKNSKPGF